MIYLDNNATTEPSAAAIEAAERGVRELWANPSSVHRAGQDTRQSLELARAQVGRMLSVKPRDLTLTSGATESIDLALRGVVASVAGKRNLVISSAIEHEAVRDTCSSLRETQGTEILHLDVSSEGVVSTEHLESVLQERGDEVALVSLQWANNETGTIQPVQRIGELCREFHVLFHTDATQAIGKLPISLDAGPERSAFALEEPEDGVEDAKVPVDLLSCSGHKFHGIKGAGVLFARRGVRVVPQTLGTQERGRRGGTEAVPAILGMGAAAEEAMLLSRDSERLGEIAALRDSFERSVLARAPGAVVNCAAPPNGRLVNTTNIAFPSLEAEIILLALSERGVAASAGAACSSGSLDPSPVLLAMGIPERLAHGSLRFSLSKHTTAAELESAAALVAEVVAALS